MNLLTAHAGHWTSDDGSTGVTVIVLPPGTVASGEVRGGAPATREFPLLEPARMVERVDAVVLSGGSAFGLSAADGVMGVLREREQGFPTPLGPVPIVIGMSIFDASVAGTPPDAAAGRAAALAALRDEPFVAGAVGAGAGARTGKWRGRLDPGGLGMASATVASGTVASATVASATVASATVASGTVGGASVVALAVVNAWGDVIGADGKPVFGDSAPPAPEDFITLGAMGNTTLGVVLTDAKLTKNDCYLVSQSGHDGFARGMHPAHSRYDGDAIVTAATGEIDGVNLDLLRAAATELMAEAIRNAVGF